MGLQRSDCFVFDLLQTPVWIVEGEKTWFANKAALKLEAPEISLPDLGDNWSVNKFFFTIGFDTFQCTVTKITIEAERPAILVEASLDERHNLLLEASPDAVIIADADTGTILQVNNRASSLTGKKTKDLIGLHHSQLYGQEQQEKAKVAFQKCLGGWSTGWFIPRTDRLPVPVDVFSTLFASSGKRYLYGFFRDQTEQQIIEGEWYKTLSELEQRESQLKLALSGANVICWDYSFNTDQVKGIGTFTPKGWEMLSWQMSLDEALALIYPPDIETVRREVSACFANGGGFCYETRLADFDSQPRWFLVSGEVLLNQSGKPDRVVGITINITQKKQMESELQANRIIIDSVMANTPACICLKDNNQRYTYGNCHLLNVLGLDYQDFIGKTNQDVFPPDIALTLDYIDRQVIETQKSIQTELEVTFDGKSQVYLSTRFPLFNQNNEIQGVGGIATDITELKRTESAMLENQAYLNCLISIQQQLLIDDDGDKYPSILQQLGETAKASRVYIFANHQSEEGLLLSSQIYEWCAPGIKPETDNPELQNVNMEINFPRWIKQFLQGQEISGIVADFPEEERKILESQQILSILVLPLFVNQRFWGFIGFDNCQSSIPWSDSAIGLLRSAASAISFHLERQENRRILIEERQKADAANAAKSSFLANMSHELRTPMNAVIGLTSLLQTTLMTEEQRDYIRTIRNSSEALLSLINDILDFSKIEAGRIDLEIQEFNLRSCIEEAIDLMTPQASQKGLEIFYWLSPDVPEWIRSDVTRLRQILLNLLSNAVKFTDQGNITIEVGVAERINDQDIKLFFTVTDEGIGIPPDRLEHIFSPFTQADSSITRRYGGTGLGLSICYRLCNLLGGEMSVTTAVGQGSSFKFSIKTKVAEPLVNPPTLPVKRIYVSLEQPPLQQMVESMLRSCKMEVTEERRGADLIITESIDDQCSKPQILVLSHGQDSHHSLILSKPVRYEALFDLLTRAFLSTITTKTVTYAVTDLVHLPLRILVAEDNIVNQKVCLKILKKLNYDADLVANGLEALEATARQVYDVILMDIQMPEMDGLSATRAIRQRSGEQPWIIALTADAQVETAQQSYAVGANDYITKPVRIDDLALALRRAYYRLKSLAVTNLG